MRSRRDNSRNATNVSSQPAGRFRPVSYRVLGTRPRCISASDLSLRDESGVSVRLASLFGLEPELRTWYHGRRCTILETSRGASCECTSTQRRHKVRRCVTTGMTTLGRSEDVPWCYPVHMGSRGQSTNVQGRLQMAPSRAVAACPPPARPGAEAESTSSFVAVDGVANEDCARSACIPSGDLGACPHHPADCARVAS